MARSNVEALADGSVCVADVQVSGRGRGGNTWSSPPGCLMFSFNTRCGASCAARRHAPPEALARSIVDGRTLPFLQYVVTLAVVEAVQDAARAALQAAGVAESALEVVDVADGSRRCVDVRIKWPNDVYGGGVKLGGVLCGSTHGGGAFRVTVGAGLNVSNQQPTSCLDALIAAAATARGAPHKPPPLCAAALLAGVLSRYEALEARFVSEGFSPLQPSYLHHWLHTGQRVTLEEAGSPGAPPRLVALTVRGLTPGGYLLAQDDAGERFELCPDGNSLDFFKGLVRKKLAR